MNIIFHTASDFCDIFSGISEILSVIRLEVTPTGIISNCLGSSGVSFVSLFLSENYFKAYNYNQIDSGSSNENIHLLLELKFVLKVISKFQRDDELNLMYTKGDNYVTLVQGRTTFKITMIEAEMPYNGTPNQTFVGDIEVSSIDLRDVLDMLGLYTETCMITALPKRGELILSGKGVFGEGHRSFHLSSDCGKGSYITNSYNDYFPIPFLNKFMKSYKLSRTVNVRVVEGQPILLHFPISNTSYLRYYVSPKVPDSTDSGQMDFIDE
jgi:hypothetical protein